MRVLRAAAMGMCFGVRAALEETLGVAEPGSVTIWGELVHNGEVLKELDRRGFKRTPELRRGVLPPGERLLITAHGISERERTRLLAAGKALVDTTCPLVRHVHRSALELEREGRLVLLVGRPGHVEVEGVTGDLTRFEVVANEQAVRTYPHQRLGVVSQSTTPPDRFERVLAAIRCENPRSDIRVVDTICRPTRDRQEAVRELLRQVEALVVVGGRRSNNTGELVQLAKEHGVPAVRVETADDLDREFLARFSVVGLTAGTSTLPHHIDGVHQALLAIESRMRLSS